MPKSLLQLNKMDNGAVLEIMANGTPEVFPLRGNAKTIESTWSRGTVDDKIVPASLSSAPSPPKAALIQLEDNTGKWAGFSGPIEKTWIRGTTNAAMVTEPPVPKLAPSKAANIQL